MGPSDGTITQLRSRLRDELSKRVAELEGRPIPAVEVGP